MKGYGVFQYDPQGIYRPRDAAYVYKRRHAAERCADRLNDEVTFTATDRGYVVRTVEMPEEED